jgi:hypothetical protein
VVAERGVVHRRVGVTVLHLQFRRMDVEVPHLNYMVFADASGVSGGYQ